MTDLPIHSQSATSDLADFIAGLRWEDIPEPVVRHACHDILDTLGCALFGATLPIAQPLRGLLSLGAEGQVPIWGTDWLAAADTAASVNGCLAHSFEMDDLHAEAVIHPGGCTLPAILALAHLRPVTGAELLTAHIVGLEVGTRVGVVGGAAMLRRGWHSSGVLGALAAAAGSARVLRLDHEHAQNALGTAGSLAGGLMAAQYGSMVKRLHSGNAAATGLRAAVLAERGFTGIRDLLESPYGGFLSAFAGNSDPGSISHDLGTHWEMLRVGFKPYAACGSSHTTIDVLLDLRAAHQFRPSEVSEVRIACSSTTKSHVGWPYRLGGSTAAQMNLPYAAAVALIDGTVSPVQFDDAHLQRRDIMSLAGRVEIQADPQIDRLGDLHRHEVHVDVCMVDGTVLRGHRVHARGSAQVPLNEAQLSQKFQQIAAPTLGTVGAHAVHQAVMGLADAPDTAVLEGALRPPDGD